LFAIAKQQQLEPNSPKQFKNFKDFMFPSETTAITETRIKQVDNEKSNDFVFPTEFKETTIARVLVFNDARTRNVLSSTKATVLTESTTIETIIDKEKKIVDFVFPPDFTNSRLPDYSNDKSGELDNRISLACTLTLCWGRK
jgi:hypothetical protein